MKTGFDENSLVTVPYAPYGPGLALSDSWPFGHIKTPSARCAFNGVDELAKAVSEFSNAIQPAGLQLFQH
jgi:hypothetical protein